MKYILPPMTPEQAATSVLNVCMHCFNNKQPWDEARNVLVQLFNDANEIGYNKGLQDGQNAANKLAAQENETKKEPAAENEITNIETEQTTGV